MFKQLIFISLFLFPIFILGQSEYRPLSDCDNKNTFLRSLESNNLRLISHNVRPHGLIYLNAERSGEYSDLESLYKFLDLNKNYNLIEEKEFRSRFDQDIFFRRYQQYYKGVRISGGGLTATYRAPNIGGPVGPGPSNPCAQLAKIMPHLITNLNIETKPSINQQAIRNKFKQSQVDLIELLIEPNLLSKCTPRLVYKVFHQEETPKITWVDANTGKILKSVDTKDDIMAPTASYGNRNLNDRTVGGTTTLESPDGVLSVFDFDDNCPNNTTGWNTDLIPETTNTSWTTESTPEVYQAFFSSSLVAAEYAGIGIDFANINVGVCTEFGAFSLGGSNINNAFITLGVIDNGTTSIHDVVAHELGHSFLNQFFTSAGSLDNASIHEGISDILGTYIESLIQGNVDWIIGDDEPDVSNLIDRDLENPSFSCMSSVPDQRHLRGLVLGHWFYRASTVGQYAIGLERTIEIILEALPTMSGILDIEDFMNATLDVAENNFGRCSDEYSAIADAWDDICVDVSGRGPCNYSVTGPYSICEESNYAKFCIDGGMPGAHYRWTIIGSQSVYYESVCGMQGNSQEGCNCLTLIDFPQYPYYPQYLEIKVYSPTVGPDYIVYKKFKLRDCDGDDPTCEEYYGLGKLSDAGKQELDALKVNYNKDDLICNVYDIYGRLLYSGEKSMFYNLNKNKDLGIVIFAFYNEDGQLIAKEKELILYK